METEFRLANEDDMDRIMEIITIVVKIMNESGNFQWDDTYPTPEKFRSDISKGNLWVCVEKLENIIVGVCAITNDQDPEYRDCGWDIDELAIVPHRLAIHPDYRRYGIGRKFLQLAEQIGIERGIKYLRIDTITVNQPMQNLFKQLNYEYKGEITIPCKKPGLRFYCYDKTLI
jgi:ribosomal protein S18 acetylase RimI-like enzyme